MSERSNLCDLASRGSQHRMRSGATCCNPLIARSGRRWTEFAEAIDHPNARDPAGQRCVSNTGHWPNSDEISGDRARCRRSSQWTPPGRCRAQPTHAIPPPQRDPAVQPRHQQWRSARLTGSASRSGRRSRARSEYLTQIFARTATHQSQPLFGPDRHDRATPTCSATEVCQAARRAVPQRSDPGLRSMLA